MMKVNKNESDHAILAVVRIIIIMVTVTSAAAVASVRAFLWSDSDAVLSYMY